MAHACSANAAEAVIRLKPGRTGLGRRLPGSMGEWPAALRASGIRRRCVSSNVVWNAETLVRFLANPRQLVSGTTMTVRVTNEAQR